MFLRSLTFLQQVYIAALWYWGSTLTKLSATGTVTTNLVATRPVVVTSVGASIAVLLWIIGIMLFIGLPEYYRQTPGAVPNFFTSVMRRKIVLWFFAMVVSVVCHVDL